MVTNRSAKATLRAAKTIARDAERGRGGTKAPASWTGAALASGGLDGLRARLSPYFVYGVGDGAGGAPHGAYGCSNDEVQAWYE